MRFAVLPLLAALALSACTLPWSTDPEDMRVAPAQPPVLGPFAQDAPVATPQDWQSRRVPLLKAAFETHVYGPLPAPREARLISKRPLALERLEGHPAEEWTIAVTDGPDPLTFTMVVLLPADAPGPHPVIVMQNFCGNRAALPGRPEMVSVSDNLFEPCNGTFFEPLIELIFGRHITAPPADDILARGYALAMFYPGDVVPDDDETADAALARLAAEGAVPEDRPGTLAAWAWLYARALDVLEQDARIDKDRTAIWGHSRHGKSALLAGAVDPRVDAVIAHQSGRGGAALNRSDIGESIEQITDGFPHWFGARYGGYASMAEALPVDQHQLIAMIAPRPVFIGAARADTWSDPRSAFVALEGADPAYELLGADGLVQNSMREPAWSADLVYVLTGGWHGVTTEDWDNFLTFLDAQFALP